MRHPLNKTAFLRASLSAMLLILCITQASSMTFPNEIYSPKRGAAERKEVLNAIRPLVEARAGPPVEFVVDRLRIYKGWAFVVVNPQRPGGGKIDPNGKNYRLGQFQDGLHTYALLKFRYGRWNIIDFVIGPTDVFWEGDPLYEQFPRNFIY